MSECPERSVVRIVRERQDFPGLGDFECEIADIVRRQIVFGFQAEFSHPSRYTSDMIRPATPPADIDAILALTAGTGFFKPLEVETLEDVLTDFFDHNYEFGHRCFVWDEAGSVRGYVYYAPEEMTERRLQIWAHPAWAGTLIGLLAVFWIGRKAAGVF